MVLSIHLDFIGFAWQQRGRSCTLKQAFPPSHLIICRLGEKECKLKSPSPLYLQHETRQAIFSPPNQEPEKWKPVIILAGEKKERTSDMELDNKLQQAWRWKPVWSIQGTQSHSVHLNLHHPVPYQRECTSKMLLFGCASCEMQNYNVGPVICGFLSIILQF